MLRLVRPFLHFYFRKLVFTARLWRVVNAYPDDPQARMGLISCMEVLKALEIVWPSAGRAWELLRGSNVIAGGTNSPDFANSSPSSSRPTSKRTAENFLEDAHFFAGAPVPSIPGAGVRTSSATSQPSHGFGLSPPTIPAIAASAHPSSSTPNPGSASSQPHSHSNGGPGSNGSYYPSSYDRWPGDGGLNAFPTSLSTSVLPQQYSTGFAVDDHRARTTSANDTGGTASSSRYPQYWSDYSSLGSLGGSFGVPMLPQEGLGQTQQHQQHQAHANSHTHTQQGPVQDQYQHMFGE